MSAEQELSFGVETITPEIAAAYLKRKGANRNISHLRVQRYAREMQRGDWLLTGEAIKFCNGQLMDGQQRLLAVIESGVSVRMPVIRYRKGEPMTQLKWSQGGARPEPFPKPV